MSVFLPKLQIPERATLALFAILGAAYVGLFYKKILEHSAALFVLSIIVLAASVLADIFPQRWLPVPGLVVEDGLKLIGVFCWSFFHITAAFTTLSSVGEDDTDRS